MSRLAITFLILFALLGPIALLASRNVTLLLAAVALLLVAHPTARAATLDGLGMRGDSRTRRVAAGALMLLVVWMCITLAWTPDPQRGALQAAKFLALSTAGCIGLLGLPRCPPEVGRGATLGLSIGLSLAVGFLAVDLVTGNALTDLIAIARGLDPALLEPRLALFNRTAVIIAVLMWPAAVALGHRTHAAFGLALLALCAAVAVALPMRAIPVALIPAVAAAALVLAAPRSGGRALAILFAVGIVCLVPAAIVFDLPQTLAGIGREQVEGSLLHRLRIWQFVIERIADRPVHGWGLGSSRDLEGGQAVAAGFGPGVVVLPLHPHNALLQIWLELGAVGAILFAALGTTLFLAIGRLGAGAPVRAAAAGCAVTFVGIAMLSYGAWQSWWVALAWIAVVVVGALGRQDRSA